MYTIITAGERHRKDINRLIRGAKLGSGLGRGEAVKNFWIVKEGERVIACAGMDFYNDAAILTYLAVEKEFRHRGIGGSLIVHRLKTATERGATASALVTMYYHFNFYKRRGFRTCPRKELPEEIKEYPMFTAKRYMKCAVMWKRLR